MKRLLSGALAYFLMVSIAHCSNVPFPNYFNARRIFTIVCWCDSFKWKSSCFFFFFNHKKFLVTCDRFRFLLMVRKGYRNPPYHNWIHAFTVAHFCYLLFKNARITHQLRSENFVHLSTGLFKCYPSSIPPFPTHP